MPVRNKNDLTVSSSIASSSLYPSARLSPRPLSAKQRLLATSPPPSPGLPSLVPRHGKKFDGVSSKLLKRLLFLLCGVIAFVWFALSWFTGGRDRPPVEIPNDAKHAHGMSNEIQLPPDPAVVIVSPRSGKKKWTVSIPAKFDFPLEPAQYHDICKKTMEVAHHVSEMTTTLSKRHQAYNQAEPNFMDVGEAQSQGLLPRSDPSQKPLGLVGMVDETQVPGSKKKDVCARSLTYVLETSDAGLGKSLMGLWGAYGLAKKEERAFFLDDTWWPYGNYTTYFKPPPVPNCLPPAKSQMLPCPHTAQHLVVSAATSRNTWGHSFHDEYEDPRKMETERQHRIFALLRDGYEALFHLQGDDQKFVDDRSRELYDATLEKGGYSVGVHVRRGDRHPLEFQYSKDYLPIYRYLDVAADIVTEYFSSGDNQGPSKTPRSWLSRASKTPRADTPTAKLPDQIAKLLASKDSQIVFASDDPDLYSSPEVESLTVRAQSRITLASKKQLDQLEAAGQDGKPRPPKYIDDVSGWEGGFYQDVFWSLGRSASAKSTSELKDEAMRRRGGKAVGGEALRMRELVGRAYLLDLAVLGRAPAVVCALSATGCRLLSVMIGWEAVGESRWRNVDGQHPWRGIDW